MTGSKTIHVKLDGTGEPSKLQNFINGSYVAPAGGKYMESMNPSTGHVLCLVPDSDAADVDAAVAAAAAAFPAWSETSPRVRSQLLNKIADILERRLEEFARAESADQGKTVKTARTVDIPRAIHNFRFFAGAILHHEDRSTVLEELKCINYSTRMAIGVAGLISPWNLPLYLLTWKIAPAIATGNTCVCKPSELTSVTACMLGEVLNEAGVPAGVVNLVFGYGARAGQALVGHSNVPLISGGTVTAEHIIKTSAPFYKKLSLELGGKNANIIFDDADLDKCIGDSVRSSFSNQGEICLCGSRLFVQRGVYDEYVKRFVAAAAKWKAGDPEDASSDMGALISKDHLNKVQSYIDLARSEGATIALGGGRPEGISDKHQNGYWLSPTIITNLPLTSKCLSDEIFGPVVTITPFTTMDEVIGYANGIKYGLAACVWSTNISTALKVSQALRVGTVWVNCWMIRDLRMPFGGMKASGIGREGGEYSIDFYTEAKTVCIKL